MSNIKNFGLVGVATDVQFGKAGPRLVNDSQVFKFKDAAGTNAAQIVAGNATVAGLTVDADGTIDMGANKVTNMAPGAADADGVTFKQLTDAISAASSTASGANSALQTEVNAIETAIGLGTDGTLVAFATGTSAGPAAGATSYKNAIELVSAALKGEIDRATAAEALVSGNLTTEISDRTAAVQAVADDLAAEITRATTAEATKLALAGGTMTGALILAADPTAANGAATKNYVDSVAGGLTWQAPVAIKVADAAAMATAASSLVAGDRVLVDADGKIYTFDGDAFDAGVTPSTSWALFDNADEQGYVFNGTTWVQFTGTGQIVAGLGLSKNGNRMDIELATDSGLHFAPDETSDTSKLIIKLDGESLVLGSGGLKISDTLTTEITALRTDLGTETTARTSAVSGLQTELDATQAGAGLGTTGTYTADSASNYMTTATSLFNADQKLDAAIKAVADSVSALESGSVGGLQDEVDALETSLGAMVDGTGAFVAPSETNYIDTATDISDAIAKIDAALKAVDTAYQAADTAIGTRIGALTTSDIAEGTKLFWTQARFDAAFAAKTTDDLAEGSTNLYFTTDRVHAALSVATVAGTDAAKLAYDSATGQFSLVNVASVKDVADALQTAKDYADAGDVTTLQAAKDYADTVAQTAANSVLHVAKSVYQEFAYTDNPSKSIALDVKGRVHRVKVMIDTGFDASASIQVGTSTVNGQLMTTADIDPTTAGVYVVEINQLYSTNTELLVFIGGTALSSGAGAVIVEYFTV